MPKLVFKQCLKLRTSKSTGIINIELEVSHKREVMTLVADQVVCTSVVGYERVTNDAARAIDTHPLDADINIIDATAFICEFSSLKFEKEAQSDQGVEPHSEILCNVK